MISNEQFADSPQPTGDVLELARRVLTIEARAVEALRDRLDDSFTRAVQLILHSSGRVVVSGMGKSGHIARKIASTMASTGTPAFFVHPAEASHGDLGMITQHDVLIALSNSGESAELLTIVPLLKRKGAKLIAMTGNAKSTLALEADVHLDASVEQEACPLGLAPTASTTAALALGDALAIALLDARGFGADDFARSHPGGALGRRLLVHVKDIMHKGENLPKVPQDATLSDALLEMTRKGLGMTAIVDAEDRVLGIFTDGDLRRTLDKTADIHGTPIGSVMKANPRTIAPEVLAAEAVQQMEQYKINGLLVADADKRLVGALNMHDLLKAGVV
jgi:arabinose-5-phosphate isomerase